MKRHDYLPFGEELYSGIGGRSPALGYSGDASRQKFTSKERDIETGLDYFLARYYWSTQGRFTSPDEFSGGPNELYTFTEAASGNPTFYADLTNPQSLNKYQYTNNNPVNMVDPDGHCPEGQPCPSLIVPTPTTTNATIGVLKAVVNIGIGMNNVVAHFGGANAKHIEPYQPDNLAQAVGMVITEDVTFFGALLGGRAQVGGVAIAEGQTTTVVAARVGNARASAAEASTIERTVATAPYKRPTGATTAEQRASVQGKPCAVCGESAPKMYAGHKEALVKEHYRTGTIDRGRMRDLSAVRSECPTCSNREGASLSRYSRVMKNQIPQ